VRSAVDSSDGGSDLLIPAITEIRELESKITACRMEYEAERSRYRELFDLNPDAYLVTGRTGIITEANLAASVLLGVPAEYLPGKPLAVYVGLNDRPTLREAIQAMVILNQNELTIRISPRGAAVRTGFIRMAAIREEIGMPLLAIRWVIRDITEARAAQEELASNREKLRELTSELSLAEERVRREIAVGIHDRVSQPLALAKMLVGKIRLLSGEKNQPDADELNKLLQQALDESRTLTFELSPPVLYELGLPAAVEWLAEQMQRRFGLKIRPHTTNWTKPIRLDLRVLLFQSIRELLTNVIKHAKASSAAVALICDDDTIKVVISDDGGGFNPEKSTRPPEQPGGFGLFSIRTRVERVGGHFSIESKARRGTRVTMIIPMEVEK
jgi:PAS domain S-box-containing protein